MIENWNEDSIKFFNMFEIYEMFIVKGGLYEVDVVVRECKFIYWEGWCNR